MNKIAFTQESHYLETMQSHVTPFWERRQHGFYQGEKETQLHWVSFTSPANRKAIMVVNGRIESVYKYQELFYDLFCQGYDIYSFDHRGQGLSDRLTTNRDIGHIEEFNDYILDLNSMTQHLIAPEDYQDCYLLGHSMGGAIATQYVETHSHPYSAVALSAPMHGIHIQPWLKPIAGPISHYLSRWASQPSYALGQAPYHAKPFLDNTLTTCEIRYQWFRELYNLKPELQIGGPSNHWVNQSLKGSKLCVEQAASCSVPVLLLQGENDRIVDNNAHTTFQKNAPDCQLITIKNAKHELLFESDVCRNQALSNILDFFQQHRSPLEV
ncbi:alpha/beta fold hydrolase [Aliivibrio finisterrensis]|uniref:alpha/beta fold hydrolase n=1 Tax=Aliivibrio finisterrensis TaxID=511998 RepID=UPI00102041B9|nr:alpha/beta fold hydrolase [Aliivibrio finisterrensis]RYU66703.1 alpha/beta fold hydrolase [Aliivibrio finisterrensis]RYU69821.1 alpha/beta fold hydrolase [Aliivibrio finisterrensis]RYU73608.1 alpha/beta fold hydrolase [Aliivibrio finisterrensis]